MSAAAFFEQFVGDPLIDYAPLETRLVYIPTGEYIVYDKAQNFHKQAMQLWEQVGSPQMWLGSFTSSTAIEVWAYGQLLSRSEQ